MDCFQRSPEFLLVDGDLIGQGRLIRYRFMQGRKTRLATLLFAVEVSCDGK
jgi:hypothetical protein